MYMLGSVWGFGCAVSHCIHCMLFTDFPELGQCQRISLCECCLSGIVPQYHTELQNRYGHRLADTQVWPSRFSSGSCFYALCTINVLEA